MRSNFDIRVEKVHLLPAMVGLHCRQRELHFPQGAKGQCRPSATNLPLSRPMNLGLYIDLGKEIM